MEQNFFQKTLTQNQRGFSLIEILIALTLLALAGTFVGGRIFNSYQEGQVNSTKIQINSLDARLKEFRRKCGFYPTTEQGLDALVSKPTSGRECKDYPQNGFIDGDQVPKDPWDNDFAYESDGKTYNIISYGGNGEAGGDGTDADISLRAAAKGSAPTEEAPAPAAGEGNNEAAPQ